MKKLLIVLLLLWLSLMTSAFEETILELRIAYKDGTLKNKEVIEAIESDGDVLLPLTTLSSLLQIDVDLNRNEGQFTLSSENKTFNFTKDGYEQYSLLANKKPILLEGKIYVHLTVFEILIPLIATYDSSQLIITLSLPDLPPSQEKVEGETTLSPSSNNIKPVKAPDKTLSFSSFEYQLKQTYRKEGAITEADLYLHLRAGLAEISFGSHLEGKNLLILKPSNPFFKLKLEKDNTLFLVGNSAITSETRLADRAFFGVTLIKPYPLIYTSYPSVPLEIFGEKGETVTVLINDRPVMSVIIPAEGRVLTTVPLKPYRLQEISLKRSKDEQTTVISSHNGLKLAPPKTTQMQLYYGLYGKEPYKWQGELLEAKTYSALTKNTTLKTILVWQAPDYQLRSPSIKLELLSELLPGYNNVSALYIAGQSEVGGEIDFIFTLTNNHWQLGYFNLPPKVSYYWPKPQGHGLHFFTTADITPFLYLEADAQVLFKTKDTPTLRSYRGLLSYQFINPQSNIQFGLSGVESYIPITATVLVENSLHFSYKLKSPKISFSLKDNIRNLNYAGENWQKQNFESSLEVAITPNSLAGMEFSIEADNKEKVIGSFSTDINIALPKQNLYSTFILDSTLKPTTKTDNWNFSLGSQWARSNPGLKLELQRNQGQKGNYWLTTGQTFYNWTNNRLSLTIGLKLAEAKSPDTTWRLNWKNQFSTGVDMAISIEKLPLVHNAVKNEYLATISLSQGLAFTSNGLIGHTYTGQNISALICGFVFLDLDGNGKKDPGEPGIKDIVVRLGYKTITTKEDGSFVFGSLESGLYQFGFDPKKLNADYSAPLLGFPVKIKAGDNLVFDLPLTMNGVLEGNVFIDIDGDGKFSNEDELLDWVQVKLLGTNYKTFTNQLGHFYFENLPLGSFTVVVDEKTLPPLLKPSDPILITITPDQLDTFIDLPLKY